MKGGSTCMQKVLGRPGKALEKLVPVSVANAELDRLIQAASYLHFVVVILNYHFMTVLNNWDIKLQYILMTFYKGIFTYSNTRHTHIIQSNSTTSNQSWHSALRMPLLPELRETINACWIRTSLTMSPYSAHILQYTAEQSQIYHTTFSTTDNTSVVSKKLGAETYYIRVSYR